MPFRSFRGVFSASRRCKKHLKSGIDSPKDLAGKRIGLSSYQNTLGVRAKGDLDHFYGVPWKSVTWVAAGEDVLSVEPPKGVKLERAKNMAEIEQKFIEGTIHALFVSRLPRPFLERDPNVGRFFADPAGEEERYLREEGYFPIMHVLAFKRELSERFPELPAALFQLFEQARRTARQRWNDPNWSMLLRGRREFEHQERVCNFDPWRNGLDPNRKNIQRFALYSYEQGLSRRQWQPEDLFVPINDDDRESPGVRQEPPSRKHPW